MREVHVLYVGQQQTCSSLRGRITIQTCLLCSRQCCAPSTQVPMLTTVRIATCVMHELLLPPCVTPSLCAGTFVQLPTCTLQRCGCCCAGLHTRCTNTPPRSCCSTAAWHPAAAAAAGPGGPRWVLPLSLLLLCTRSSHSMAKPHLCRCCRPCCTTRGIQGLAGNCCCHHQHHQANMQCVNRVHMQLPLLLLGVVAVVCAMLAAVCAAAAAGPAVTG
jgi:hypothetical protein